MFFAPETIAVGQHQYTFQDGGVTPFNNPALMLYTMATQEEFEISWPQSDTDLLLVSIGTGAAHQSTERSAS